MLDEALEETFPARNPVSAEQRVIVGRVGKLKYKHFADKPLPMRVSNRFRYVQGRFLRWQLEHATHLVAAPRAEFLLRLEPLSVQNG